MCAGGGVMFADDLAQGEAAGAGDGADDDIGDTELGAAQGD